MTYVLYKNSNVAWQGKGLNKALIEKIKKSHGVTITKDAFRSPEQLDHYQIYKLVEAPKIAGKIITVTNHQKDGYLVHEVYTEVDDPDYVVPDPVEQTKASLIVGIKAEAGRRIIEIVPEWKQRNLTARAAQFAKQVADGIPLTTEQQAVWNAGEAVWLQVDGIRTQSDILEANLDGMTLEELQQFDPLDEENW